MKKTFNGKSLYELKNMTSEKSVLKSVFIHAGHEHGQEFKDYDLVAQVETWDDTFLRAREQRPEQTLEYIEREFKKFMKKEGAKVGLIIHYSLYDHHFEYIVEA